MRHDDGSDLPSIDPSRAADEEAEEIAAERELAEDAEWKKIQQNTFTRWANEHLKAAHKHIDNLETDLSDGLRLIALVSALSQKQLPRYNKNPRLRSQKLENVSVALRFLEHDERIKIVNIDSSDIVDCKLKLILGLIWTLILHYSIFLPMFNFEDKAQSKSTPTPKQRLLSWIQSKLCDLPVGNFTSDWNDGRAVGALVDAIAPGLCPDWSDWKPTNALHNAKEAMGLAEDWLGVPQLITPEEMTNPNVDELSMMTYLSQFPNAKLKPGAPLRPRSNPNRPWERVRAYGLGVEPRGVVEGAPAPFLIDTFSAGKGVVDVKVFGPGGKPEPVEVVFSDDRKMIYSCTYTPRFEGQYTVVVRFNDHEIPKSPFKVTVEGHAGDPSKVTVSGPGIEREGVMINRPTHFDIVGKDAGLGVPDVIVLSPTGDRNVVTAKLRPLSEHSWRCEYTSPVTGLLSVNVFFAGKAIPKSPFGVNVAPVCDARKVRASGRGLQSRGVRVKDDACFKVSTEGAGEGALDIKAIGPNGTVIPVNIRALDNGVFDCVYRPVKDGLHKVAISYGGQEIPDSPYSVHVGPYKDCRIRAFGPGLERGVAGHPSTFTVYMNGEVGTLGFTVEGPSEARIEFHDNEDGSAKVTYYPTAPGEYSIHILCDAEDIPRSPYIAHVSPQRPDVHPELVESYGPGLEKDGVQVDQLTEFTVDSRRAGSGDADLEVVVLDPQQNITPSEVAKTTEGTYRCQYLPKKGGTHEVQVNYGGVSTRGSPKRVNVIDPDASNKVQVFGPGVEKGVKCLTPTHFNIDARDAGSGNIAVGISDEKGRPVSYHLADHGDNTYTVEYTAQTSGVHAVRVQYDGRQVRDSPFRVNVVSPVDLNRIRVDGLQPTMFLNATNEFLVDANAVSQGDDGHCISCVVRNPSGARIPCEVAPAGEGVSRVSFTPFEEGPHTVDLLYDGVPLPKSPATVHVRQGCDPTKCKVYGPGVQSGVAGRPNQFVMNTKAAGTGAVGVAIEGPSEAKMSYKDNQDGSCIVEYLPSEPGVYDISVRFADQHVPGSPFRVTVEPDPSAASGTRGVGPSAVRCAGPGVDPAQIRAEVPLVFTVDTSRAAAAEVGVEVQPDRGIIRKPPSIVSLGQGVFEVTYFVPEQCSSPFNFRVLPTCEPEKVKVSGPPISGKDVPASLPTEICVDTVDAGFGNLEVQVTGPDSRPRRISVDDHEDGVFRARFVPDEIGTFVCDVKYGNREVPGSPFSFAANPVGKADSCVVLEEEEEQRLEEEEEVVTSEKRRLMTVNAQHAGEGAVTCRMYSSTTSEEVTTEVVEQTKGVYKIYYNASKAGEYQSEVNFGGVPVRGGQRTVTVREERESLSNSVLSESSASGSRKDFRPVELYHIPLPSTGGHVTAEIIMPSSKKDKPLIKDNRDGTVSIHYEPREEGTHELILKYNGEPVRGSPFRFYVDSISSGYISAHGPGLTHGICGEPCHFTIFTKDVTAGGLSLSVEGPSKTDITCHDNKDGSLSVSYLPTSPGEYKVTCKLGDKHIRGSPYTVKITGEGRKRNIISVGSSSEVSIPGKFPNIDLRTLNASILAPSGLEEPCFLKKLPNGSLGISFTPREKGQHVISVKRMGNDIPESPFKIDIKESEVGNALRVKVSGDGLKHGKTHIDNTFIIDTKEAGFGGLSLSIEGPSKADIKCDDLKDGKLKIAYRPTEPGYYIINLKFADHHVMGSPFTVHITGEGSNRQTERIKRHHDAVPTTEVGSKCKFTFRIPGVSEDAEIIEVDDGFYAVNFVPKELGVHTVSVRLRDVHIPGNQRTSFRKDGGAHRVHAGGPGLECGEVNTACEFNVWTREAGAGSLSVSVEGPSKAHIDCKDRNDGSCYVSYTVAEQGKEVAEKGAQETSSVIVETVYKESKKHAGPVIPKFKSNASKVTCKGLGLKKAYLNKMNQFTVNTEDAGPKNPTEEVLIKHTGRNNYQVNYLVKDRGEHLLYVKWGDDHIPGSPFRVEC